MNRPNCNLKLNALTDSDMIDAKDREPLDEVQYNNDAESIDTQLETALKIAVEAHFGQKDKGGRPYIFHPLRVAARCSGKAKVAALLHDTVEDTSVTFEQLAELGIDGEILAAVRLLTHDKSIPYFDYVRKVKENPIAREVKLSDLMDNMDLKRLKILTDEDIRRLEKYHEAYTILKD
jgi:(p)ppGpp synthase/HD superfamily hydrolase